MSSSASSTRVYVGRLAQDAREEDVQGLFKSIGDIKEINLKTGFGFVEFVNYDDAEAACKELNGASFLGERLVVEMSRGDKRKPMSHSTSKYGPPQRTNFRCIVQDLSQSVSWQDLKDFMRKGGDVVYSDAHRNKPGEGVVEFATLDDLRNAIRKLDGEDLKGQKVSLIEDRSLTSRVRQSSPLRPNALQQSRKHSRSLSRSPPPREERERDRDRARSRTPPPSSSSRRRKSISPRESRGYDSKGYESSKRRDSRERNRERESGGYRDRERDEYKRENKRDEYRDSDRRRDTRERSRSPLGKGGGRRRSYSPRAR